MVELAYIDQDALAGLRRIAPSVRNKRPILAAVGRRAVATALTPPMKLNVGAFERIRFGTLLRAISREESYP